MPAQVLHQAVLVELCSESGGEPVWCLYQYAALIKVMGVVNRHQVGSERSQRRDVTVRGLSFPADHGFPYVATPGLDVPQDGLCCRHDPPLNTHSAGDVLFMNDADILAPHYRPNRSPTPHDLRHVTSVKKQALSMSCNLAVAGGEARARTRA
ncbi:hypothetical protein MUK60_42305 [Streptomyces sp. LRE541]|uniref:hypothetical protein n=1 Tax=Streptomyces sp. LRE541 TaxID=2931983 RepID=UPI00200E893E|nr:hypothetical protein [Streptomyces sp. LRE541]UPZ33856.1 hypothetical protein MUK60_42305 [Streptomyces sp. LRE541]